MNETAPVRMPSRDRVATPDNAAESRLSVQIREATFADYQQVAVLQAQHGLATKSYADWCALWSRNPAYLKSSHQMPIGWVLERRNGSIVGFLGNLPLSYKFRGDELLAATAHSWVVDDRYRGHSIGLLNTFLKQIPVDLFVFTTVNPSAEGILRALRLSKIPVGSWDIARFWITGYRGFSRSAMAAHSIPLPSVAATPLAGALWARDLLFRHAFRERLCEIESDLEINVSGEFDARFEQFWKTSERQNQNRLWAVRDRETLAWHYGSAISQGTLWVVTAMLRGNLVGYWVVDRQDRPELRLKRLRFVDFQALSGHEHLLRTAIAWMLQKCRQEGIHVADDLGSWLERSNIPGTIGPYRRQMKSWLFYYRARRGELAEQLGDPSVWAPSSYDGDASL